MRCVLTADNKPLHWVGSSKRDFLSFAAAVKEDMGVAERLTIAENDDEGHDGKTKH